jgi:hypothetical protein
VVDAETRCGIESLIVEYAWLLDHGEAMHLADLFAEDAILELPRGQYAGREAIAAFGRERAKLARITRHVCSNIRLRPLGPDKVEGTVVFTSYRHDGEGLVEPQAQALGDWHDVYVREADGRWRFSERRVVLVFESEAHRQ